MRLVNRALVLAVLVFLLSVVLADDGVRGIPAVTMILIVGRDAARPRW